MIDLRDEEVKAISGGDVVCSESGVLYFKQDEKNSMRVYAILEGTDEDFDKLINQMQVQL